MDFERVSHRHVLRCSRHLPAHEQAVLEILLPTEQEISANGQLSPAAFIGRQLASAHGFVRGGRLCDLAPGCDEAERVDWVRRSLPVRYFSEVLGAMRSPDPEEERGDSGTHSA